MVFHGLDVTHLDSLAHLFWDGKMYGGAPASLVSDVRAPSCTTCWRCPG